jgi:hypothetical protein
VLAGILDVFDVDAGTLEDDAITGSKEERLELVGLTELVGLIELVGLTEELGTVTWEDMSSSHVSNMKFLLPFYSSV